MLKPEFNFEFDLPMTILKEGRHFVAYSPALDLSTTGGSYIEARARFNDAVVIFFEELVCGDDLELALKELGWRKVRKRWRPPVVVANGSERISLPIRI